MTRKNASKKLLLFQLSRKIRSRLSALRRRAECGMYPDLMDIATNWGGSPDVKRLEDAGIFVSGGFLGYEEQLSCRYLLDIDGHTCTYPSLQWKLLSNSLVLKQTTPNRMWFYRILKPWVHYVPLKEDMSDLLEKVSWCLEHEEEAYRIACASRELALQNLMPEHTVLYCYKALRKYAQYLRFQPR